MSTNRTLEEKQIARKIVTLKNKQREYRKKILEADVKINNLKSKIAEFTINRMGKNRKPKHGDFYND